MIWLKHIKTMNGFSMTNYKIFIIWNTCSSHLYWDEMKLKNIFSFLSVLAIWFIKSNDMNLFFVENMMNLFGLRTVKFQHTKDDNITAAKQSNILSYYNSYGKWRHLRWCHVTNISPWQHTNTKSLNNRSTHLWLAGDMLIN